MLRRRFFNVLADERIVLYGQTDRIITLCPISSRSHRLNYAEAFKTAAFDNLVSEPAFPQFGGIFAILAGSLWAVVPITSSRHTQECFVVLLTCPRRLVQFEF